MIFSEALVGYDDMCMKRTQDVRRMSSLVATAGLDMADAMPQAARRILRDELSRDSYVLRDLLMEMPPMYSDKRGFVVPFVLNTIEQSSLMGDYPELNLVFRGTVAHPHAYAAAARLCAEQFMLRSMRYSVNSGVT